MSLYSSIARGSGALDGMPPPPTPPSLPGQEAAPGMIHGGMTDIQTPRGTHRVDMTLYESVTGIKHKKAVNTGSIRNTLLAARELFLDTEWTEDKSIKELGPSLADVIAMIVSKIK